MKDYIIKIIQIKDSDGNKRFDLFADINHVRYTNTQIIPKGQEEYNLVCHTDEYIIGILIMQLGERLKGKNQAIRVRKRAQ